MGPDNSRRVEWDTRSAYVYLRADRSLFGIMRQGHGGFDHDCQASTYEEFYNLARKAAEAVITGARYVPANIVPDGMRGIVEEEGKPTVKVTGASCYSLFTQ